MMHLPSQLFLSSWVVLLDFQGGCRRKNSRALLPFCYTCTKMQQFERPDPAMAGKTLVHTAAVWKVTPVEAYMPVIKATESKVRTWRRTGGSHRNVHERGRCSLVYRRSSHHVLRRR